MGQWSPPRMPATAGAPAAIPRESRRAPNFIKFAYFGIGPIKAAGEGCSGAISSSQGPWFSRRLLIPHRLLEEVQVPFHVNSELCFTWRNAFLRDPLN